MMNLHKKAILKIKAPLVLILFVIAILPTSCKKLLEVDLPKSKITSELVFSDDLVATAAARGMYAEMMNYSNFANGTNYSLLALAGLSSDELINTGNEALSVQFEQNSLMRDNDLVLGLWNSMYKSIYQANALMEGLKTSTGVTAATKDQLIGEALFVRAFIHFYLLNVFGKVPVVITTNYLDNSVVSRQEVSTVYAQIEKDLLDAQVLLGDAYPGGERVHPNKATATALLARVYLYTGEWTKAETQSTKLLTDTKYELINLSSITLANNREAIWQLHPSVPGNNPATNEGVYFFYGAYYNALRNDFYEQAFEAGDARKTSWVQFDGTYYLPNKYQVYGAGTSRKEYSTVFRLAEQYLIRAEARTQLNNITGAQADINAIRNRAGGGTATTTGTLANTTANDKASLLAAIEQERRVELFTEWGHRWFDLKRTGRAVSVLSPIKAGFTVNDLLYPIPQIEFDKNPKLGDQNAGY